MSPIFSREDESYNLKNSLAAYTMLWLWDPLYTRIAMHIHFWKIISKQFLVVFAYGCSHLHTQRFLGVRQYEGFKISFFFFILTALSDIKTRINSTQNPFYYIWHTEWYFPLKYFSSKTTKIEYMFLYDYILKREKYEQALWWII